MATPLTALLLAPRFAHQAGRRSVRRIPVAGAGSMAGDTGGRALLRLSLSVVLILEGGRS